MASYNPCFSERDVFRRRLAVFGLMAISTVLASMKWITVLPTDVSIFTKLLLIVLFILTFAWIALFFWSSIFGFWTLLRHKKVPGIIWPAPNAPLNSKTAILMPVYNEGTAEVMGNLLAIAKEIELTDQADKFDMFVLSDTTDPKVWVEEEYLWMQAKKLISPKINLYYRRRAKNVARKSGNIEDFCNKWGAGYDYMVILDADSLMQADTLIQMVRLMEKNPQTGIIQAPPMMINARSLFSRIQQFAGRVYGPIVSAGLAYWQVGDSNYWGHNAIIRVKAFMACCGLPVLPGKAPFGGHILSHDFVEAALIRRGGWQAWLLPELKGSFEECPPTIIDFAARDRRWCQGNLQHIKVLMSKHLHHISRIHFTIGIMSYLSSPIWLCFLLAGLAIALGREFFPPIYFTESRSLFPNWPVFDKIGTIALFIISMFMLIFPKFLGLIIYKLDNKQSKRAFISTLCEIVLSALLAPIMMMFQSKFVAEIISGKAVSWNTQNRGGDGTSWKEAWHRHKWHTILGIITTIVVAKYATELFWWMLPITLGLMLSIPLSVITSRVAVGYWAQKHNLFKIPEEENPPLLALSSQHLAAALHSLLPETRGVLLLLNQPEMNALHQFMLPVNGPAPKFGKQVEEQAQIKLENYINHKIEPDFSKEEELYLLYTPEVLNHAAVLSVLTK